MQAANRDELARMKVWNRHFQSLKERVPTAEKLTAAGDIWYVKVGQYFGNPLYSLKIVLPPKFPLESPVIAFEGNGLSHPWVNPSSNILSHPVLINNWTQWKDLGVLVEAVLHQFTSYPPTRNANAGSPAASLPKSDNLFAKGNTISHSIPFPNEMPSLSNLSFKELENLESNPEVLTAFIYDVPIVNEAVEALAFYVKKNEELYLEQQQLKKTFAKYEEKSKDEAEAFISKLVAAREKIESQGKYTQRYNQENIRNALLSAAEKHRSDAEALKKKLSKNEIKWDQFESQYLQMQKEYHRAQAMRECLQHNTS